ncbi:Rqc2 family fibronectin-binding protein [Christensenella intestinihominis]|uniref:Rqc2 family fibronectin-binding protein n=1 Tax=Christensenella intestinihominis TaxID=1851429 RepID=UPI00082C56BC|nr:NFACT RNA binding domain-containing protein [Christensenella intestinihominis]
MTLDGLTLHACVAELKERCADAKIQKVLMPGKEEVVLQLYSAGEGTLRLVLNADAGDCALYLTRNTKENPKVPPVFCMFLRKYLTGAHITGIEQRGLDRVVVFTLETKDELLHPITLRLIIEIMGKYSNIILTDAEDKILDSIRRVSVDMSSKRQVLPGARYENPPQTKFDPLTLSPTTLMEALTTHRDTKIVNHIVSVFDGVSLQTAQEILHRSGIGVLLTSELSPKLVERLAESMRDFLQRAVSHPAPCVQFNADKMPVFFSCIPYETYPAETRRAFPTVNETLDFYYGRRLLISRLKQQREALYKTVHKIYAKLQKLIGVYEATLRDAAKEQKLQKRADLITANIYRLKKGMKDFEAVDYETGETVTVPLDVSRTPQETAQKLYKKIGKLKTASAISAQKLADAREEQDFLEGVLHFTENAETPGDIADIRHTLVRAGYLSAPPKSKKEPETQSRPLRFLSPGGYEIYVGKNDRQNDQLTMRTAAKDDIWFHTQKIPGSHVLLVTNGVPLDHIDDETVVMAAELAAAHSRARQSGKTPVDYTQRKNLRKPPSARPGKVIYDDYFTVYVDAHKGLQYKPAEEG